MLLKLTRTEAEAWGLLACGTCGHPRNNHFEHSRNRHCAHCPCVAYVERARVGTLVKSARRGAALAKIESLRWLRKQIKADALMAVRGTPIEYWSAARRRAHRLEREAWLAKFV
jgi:hypothetical protein